MSPLPASGIWTIDHRANDELPGRIIEILHKDQRVAAFIYGEGQVKPYLAVYDSATRRISNPGMDSDGASRGRFPHHRGIFIGWNKVESELGSADLWHMRDGEAMRVDTVDSVINKEGVTLELVILWHTGERTDDKMDGLLLTEERRLFITRANGRTRIDHHSVLQAARDVYLNGDLQHAGLHFRADAAVDDARDSTLYLWSPAGLPSGTGRIVSNELQWVNFRFPLHRQWYAVTQLNHPANRATELSWRDYGRFGFFFAEPLQAGQSRTVIGRFFFDEIDAPGDDETHRHRAQHDFEEWIGEPQ